MGTNLINARLIGRVSSDRLMQIGAIAAALAGIAVAIDGTTGWGGLAGVIVPLFVFVSATGFIVANSNWHPRCFIA